MDKMNVNVTSENGELILREGQAAPVYAAKRVRIAGCLKAPADYLLNKQDNYSPDNCHLVVNKEQGTLELVLNEKEETGDLVTGEMKINSLVSLFGINGEKKWEINALRQLFQRSSFHFANRDEWLKMITSLQKFKSTVVRIYDNQSDNSGNSKIALENQVQEANVIKSFKLNISIFEGYEKHSFNVEIGVDVSSAETKLFLYSEELYHLMESLKENYMNAELTRFAKMEKFGGLMSIVNIS